MVLRNPDRTGGERSAGWKNGRGCARCALPMNRRALTPKVREALRQLASGPQDMRDDALLELINTELKKLPIEDITYVRDRVRFSCPPCPMVQSVVLMLDGLIEVKSLGI